MMSSLPDITSSKRDMLASLSSGRPERTGRQSRWPPHPARPFTGGLHAERHGNFAHHSRAVRCCAQAPAAPSSPSAPRSCTACRNAEPHGTAPVTPSVSQVAWSASPAQPDRTFADPLGAAPPA
jgi:hypothetical protein